MSETTVIEVRDSLDNKWQPITVTGPHGRWFNNKGVPWSRYIKICDTIFEVRKYRKKSGSA